LTITPSTADPVVSTQATITGPDPGNSHHQELAEIHLASGQDGRLTFNGHTTGGIDGSGDSFCHQNFPFPTSATDGFFASLASPSETQRPRNLRRPTITVPPGGPTVGTTLTGEKGDWDRTETEATFAYQWQSCQLTNCTDIRGAVADRYTPSPADVGTHLRLAVTASNVVGSTVAYSDQTAQVTGTGVPSTDDPIGSLPVQPPCIYDAVPPDVPVQHGCQAHD
jgi:hypothetical protein